MLMTQKSVNKDDRLDGLVIIDESPPRSPNRERPSYGAVRTSRPQDNNPIETNALILETTETCLYGCECFASLLYCIFDS